MYHVDRNPACGKFDFVDIVVRGGMLENFLILACPSMEDGTEICEVVELVR